MRIGQLRHRIEIQQPTSTQDDYGESIQDWTTIATRWGAVTPLTGRELYNASQVQPDVTHKIELRHITGITPEYRLLFDEREFHILSVLDECECRKRLVLMCKERV